MHLITPYAPPTFSRPVLIVSTMYNSATKETAIQFLDALNLWHAMDRSIDPKDEQVMKIAPSMKKTGWIIIEKHSSPGAALEHHLALTKDFINGGTEEEWKQGYKVYLELYNCHFPKEGLEFELER